MIYFFTFANGLTLASYLFILALGLNLSFGLLRIVNLTHGVFFMVGGYVGWNAFQITGNWWLSLLISGAIIGLIAFLEEFFLLRRARGKATMETLITLSVAVILADVTIWVWGGFPRQIPFPNFLRGQFWIGGMPFPRSSLFIFVFAVVIGIVFWFILRKTKIGMIIRAGVDNFEIVATLGINVRVLFTCMFAVAGFMAGIAGMVGTTVQMIAPGEDMRIMIYTLLVMILGGMGSFEGSIFGALIIAMAFVFGSLIAPHFGLFFIFAPVALILVFRPQGLLGKVVNI